jgi:prepilin-type processing-associated H-X9-DG protein
MPPGSDYSNNSWFDVDRIGRYLPKTVVENLVPTKAPSVGGSVMVCPVAEADEVKRSYSMNYWASSAVGGSVPSSGTLFDASTKMASKLILFTERWPERFGNPRPTFTRSTVGGQGATAGQRFLRILPSGTLLDNLNVADTEIDYSRHRKPRQGTAFQAKGRVCIGFVDGHVELLAHDELAFFEGNTPRSRLVAMWSPKDVERP